MNKILVCVDFSVSSGPILEQAAKSAEAGSAELILLHVAAPNPDFVGYEAGPEVVRLQMAEVYRDEHRKLQALAADLAKKGLQVTSELVQGPSAETILSHADSLGASLIILGTHGHGRLYHMILGSVSHSVLKHAKVPVLLVPAREE
jgi:nucleotide-binding universal stress UspA family protein